MLSAIPGLLTVVVIIVIARFIDHLAKLFFERVEHGWIYVRWIDKDTATPTRRIVTVVIWLFALAMAYPYLPGAHTDAFKGLSVLIGLMAYLVAWWSSGDEVIAAITGVTVTFVVRVAAWRFNLVLPGPLQVPGGEDTREQEIPRGSKR